MTPPQVIPSTTPSAAPPRTVAPDPLRAELATIQAARSALGRGDVDDALARVASYRRRFGDGALAIEARAIGAAARCLKGPIATGREQALSLFAVVEAAAYRELLREACGLQ